MEEIGHRVYIYISLYYILLKYRNARESIINRYDYCIYISIRILHIRYMVCMHIYEWYSPRCGTSRVTGRVDLCLTCLDGEVIGRPQAARARSAILEYFEELENDHFSSFRMAFRGVS